MFCTLATFFKETKLVAYRVSTRNPGFGFLKYHRKMGLRQIEQGLSSFSPNFWHIWAWFKTHQIWQKKLAHLAWPNGMRKKLEECSVQIVKKTLIIIRCAHYSFWNYVIGDFHICIYVITFLEILPFHQFYTIGLF